MNGSRLRSTSSKNGDVVWWLKRLWRRDLVFGSNVRGRTAITSIRIRGLPEATGIGIFGKETDLSIPRTAPTPDTRTTLKF